MNSQTRILRILFVVTLWIIWTSIQIAIADHFSDQYQQDTYAATHVAAALLKAGRREKIITLVNTEPVPVVIQDPVLKQEVQLQRFRIAMKVCRGAGNVSDALLTILSGTEAMSTDEIIKEMLLKIWTWPHALLKRV